MKVFSRSGKKTPDSWRLYKLEKLHTPGFQHFKVNHKYNFVDADAKVHTKNIERLWGSSKWRHKKHQDAQKVIWKRLRGGKIRKKKIAMFSGDTKSSKNDIICHAWEGSPDNVRKHLHFFFHVLQDHSIVDNEFVKKMLDMTENEWSQTQRCSLLRKIWMWNLNEKYKMAKWYILKNVCYPAPLTLAFHVCSAFLKTSTSRQIKATTIKKFAFSMTFEEGKTPEIFISDEKRTKGQLSACLDGPEDRKNMREIC